MQAELSSISSLCPGSLAGFRSVEYAPTTWAETLEIAKNASGVQRAAVGFKVGKGWLSMPIKPDSAAWAENQRSGNDNGETFEAALQATIPWDSPAIRAELDRMRRFRFLLRLRDKDSGAYFIAGTLEQPFAFSADSEIGAKIGDARNHRVRFSGVLIGKTPGYDPVI